MKLGLLITIGFTALTGTLWSTPSVKEESPVKIPYTLDVAKGESRSVDSWLKAGGRSPHGEELDVNSLYWTKNGQPWTPAMGEFHFNRFPADLWETELLKMKAGGISIVATYVFWEYTEHTKGQWDWSGNNNLRRFIELCKKAGLYVWLRPGPYINGETTHGGLPDWIDKKEGKRSNAPWAYSFSNWHPMTGSPSLG